MAQLLHPDTAFSQIMVPHPHQRHADIILVRVAGQVHGYLNSCPHVGAPLDWGDGDCRLDDQHLQCRMHGAIFTAADGMCVQGPGCGRQLTPVPLRIDEEGVWLDAGE